MENILKKKENLNLFITAMKMNRAFPIPGLIGCLKTGNKMCG